MTNEIPYKENFSHEKALNEIKKSPGSSLIRTLLKNLLK